MRQEPATRSQAVFLFSCDISQKVVAYYGNIEHTDAAAHYTEIVSSNLGLASARYRKVSGFFYSDVSRIARMCKCHSEKVNACRALLVK